MKKILVSSIALTLMCGVAQAALWSGAWDHSVSDGISTGDQFDIAGIDSAYGNGSAGVGYYFRMTLQTAITHDTRANGGAANATYMLNFNTDQNVGTGANAGNSYYTGAGLVGIDHIVDYHIDGFGASSSVHYHTYSGANDGINFDGPSLYPGVGAFLETGAQLEWFVPANLLSDNFTVRGSIVTIGNSFDDENGTETFTHDLTNPITVVPEPTSMALLALGIAALGLRRKSSK